MWLLNFVLVVFFLGLYLLPAIIAGARKHANTSAILAVNLLFGWTIIGYGVALIWSLTNSKPASK